MGTLRFIKVIIISGLAFCFLFPFLVMLATSLKESSEALDIKFHLFPEIFQWNNYSEVFSKINFIRMYGNTAFVTAGIVAGQVAISSLAAFAFARLKFPGKNVLFICILAILMIPQQIILIPNYLIINKLGWINTFGALIIPNIFSAFGTFLLRQQYMSIPLSFDEAAKMDGANPLQIFWHISLPQTYNSIMAFSLLAMIFGWNMFLWALIMTTDQNMYTLGVGLNFFQGQYDINIPLMFSAATMSVFPIVLVYLLCQKYIVDVVSTSDIK